MNDMDSILDLKVNRALLNPRFDGYKLHPADLSCACTVLDSGHLTPLTLSLEAKSYALTAAKFAFNNLLAVSPSCVAFLDSQWHLVVVAIGPSDSASGASVLATVPLPCSVSESEETVLPPSLLLVRPNSLTPTDPPDPLVLVADGGGAMHIVSLCRSSGRPLSVATYTHPQPLAVCDALYLPDTNVLHVSAYTLPEDASPSDPPSKGGSTRFQGAHLTFSLESSHLIPSATVTPTWTSRAHPLYARLSVSPTDPTAEPTLTLATSAPIHAVQTPSNPAAAPPTAPTVFHSPDFTWRWSQTASDVTIHISPSGGRITKHQVQSSFSPTHVSLHLTQPSRAIFTDAPLWAPILADDSLWTLTDNGSMVTLHMEKRDPGTRWPQLLASPADAGVLETVDPSELAGHRDQLDKYTAALPDDMDSDMGGAPASMTEAKEDVDLLADQARTHVAVVSGTRLVATRPLGAYVCPTPRGLCVQSDVDALIYTPAAGTPGLRHAATAHALAYVQASKRDRRMSLATAAWAAVADVAGQVFVYVFGRVRDGVAPQFVVETGASREDQVVGLAAVGEGGEVGRLVVVVGGRVVVVHVDRLLEATSM